MLFIDAFLLKYELNELAITSGSLIMMPFSLKEVLDDLRFLPRIQVFGQSGLILNCYYCRFLTYIKLINVNMLEYDRQTRI